MPSAKWADTNPMKKLTRRLTLLLLFCALVWVADAQTIRGYVVDQQTGDSIPYANAVYKSNKVGAAVTPLVCSLLPATKA